MNKLATSSFNNLCINFIISKFNFNNNKKSKLKVNKVKNNFLRFYFFTIKLLKDFKYCYIIKLSNKKNQDIFVFYNYIILELIDIFISNFKILKKAIIKNLDN